MNPFDELLKNSSVVAKNYAAATLNSTTFRMFKKGESKAIKKFLTQQIGDGRRLAACRSRAEYDKRLMLLIRRFQAKFHMNRKMGHRPPKIGYAAKVVNLYVKHLLSLPEYLLPYNSHNLQSFAHVPLDKWVLGRIWGDKKGTGDFRAQLKECLRHQPPTLKRLDKHDYRRIQAVLAKAARRRSIPTIAYDFFYGLRPE